MGKHRIGRSLGLGSVMPPTHPTNVGKSFSCILPERRCISRLRCSACPPSPPRFGACPRPPGRPRPRGQGLEVCLPVSSWTRQGLMAGDNISFIVHRRLFPLRRRLMTLPLTALTSQTRSPLSPGAPLQWRGCGCLGEGPLSEGV